MYSDSDGFRWFFVPSRLSEGVKTAHISQFALKGFINEALRSTLTSLIVNLVSLPAELQWHIMVKITASRVL